MLPWLLLVGGTYLCFEGAEKVTEWFGVHHGSAGTETVAEKGLVFGAIRTDLILSTEIMLIGLASLDPDLGFWPTLGALAVIGLGMTVLVYGAVALLVKVDDIGVRMTASPSVRTRRAGARLVDAMPTVFRVISVVGTVAMLWVGGHLVIANLAETFWSGPYDLLHVVEHAVEAAGPVVTWIVDTAVSAVVGLVLGMVVVGIVLGHRAPAGLVGPLTAARRRGRPGAGALRVSDGRPTTPTGTRPRAAPAHCRGHCATRGPRRRPR